MDFLRRMIKKVTSWIEPPPEVLPAPVELRVFLVRTCHYVRSLTSDNWPLTDEGIEQARKAGQEIRRRAGDAAVTVFLPVERPLSYRQTANIIAGELAVRALPSQLAYPPGGDELSVLGELGRPVVIITNGTSLERELTRCPGPPVTIGLMGPPHGSVYELVIRYRLETVWEPVQELSRWFV